VASNNACEPGEQLNVLADGDDECDRRVISILACSHSVKLCAHAAWAFLSQQPYPTPLPHTLELQSTKPSACLGDSVVNFQVDGGCV